MKKRNNKGFLTFSLGVLSYICDRLRSVINRKAYTAQKALYKGKSTEETNTGQTARESDRFLSVRKALNQTAMNTQTDKQNTNSVIFRIEPVYNTICASPSCVCFYPLAVRSWK